MNRHLFTSKLYFKVAEKCKHPFDIYGVIFSKVFYDVRQYLSSFSTTNINKDFGGKYNTLGEVFEKAHQHSIFNTWSNKIITNLGFNIILYDDRFEIENIESHEKINSLMKPEFQKRYVAQMYNLFGEPYKKHFQEIINEKRKQVVEEATFLNQ